MGSFVTKIGFQGGPSVVGSVMTKKKGFQGGPSVVVPQCYMLLCPCVYGHQQ